MSGWKLHAAVGALMLVIGLQSIARGGVLAVAGGFVAIGIGLINLTVALLRRGG
jgi:hypothetical protein